MFLKLSALRASCQVPVTRGSTAEIDYLIEIDGKVVPLEVKSSAFGHLKSLFFFLNKFDSVTSGVKLSEQNFEIKNNIKAVPIYCTKQLERIIE